jgi:PAS domain S-box-containing protein
VDTDANQLLQALRESEARLRHIVEHAQDLIYCCDPRGRFTYVNPAASRVMQYDEGELLGRHFLTLIRDDHRGRAGEFYAKQLVDATPSTYLEFPAATKSGETIWIGQHVQLVADGGRTVAVHAIARDITRQRALEDQLRQAQTMEAVGRLAGGIAHDFNNVLAAIMGHAELLLTSVDAGSPASREAGAIVRSAQRGASLTRQLLTFSSNEPPNPQPIDLQAEISADEPMLRGLAGPEVSLRIVVRGEPPIVRLDAGQFEQVLLNLIVNARDAMPDGGTIDVSVSSVDVVEQHAAKYPGLPAGRYTQIAVRDTGTGIPADARPRVFEPFFTTKETSKGSGLGLSIVYNIVRDAGGTVTFSTEERRGTTFEVLLPLHRSG